MRSKSKAKAKKLPKRPAAKAPTEAVAPRIGRPPLYAPTMCAAVLELGRAGKSRPQIARALGVGYSTMMRWTEKHPEFGEALSDAYYLAMAFWEDAGATGMSLGVRFNATAFIFLMKNRFPREYRDRQEHQVSGKDGGPIEQVHQMALPDLEDVADPKAVLRAFEAFRLGQSGTKH